MPSPQCPPEHYWNDDARLGYHFERFPVRGLAKDSAAVDVEDAIVFDAKIDKPAWLLVAVAGVDNGRFP